MFDLGMDFSTLEETEALGGVFRQDGKAGDLVEILAKNGVNAVRLRLWVNPHSASGAPYGGGTCDLPLVIRLARRAKRAGMRFLLDLHYSDFWCDPGRQLPPKGWETLTLAQLSMAFTTTRGMYWRRWSGKDSRRTWCRLATKSPTACSGRRGG